MRVLYLILLIAAGVCFAVAVVLPTPVTRAGTTITDPPRRPVSVNLVALGLLFWVLVPLIQTADRLGD